MTSDAKIGLLLGLVFIFIIAFVINGLPRFQNSVDNNMQAAEGSFLQPEPLGYGVRNSGLQEEQDIQNNINIPAANAERRNEFVSNSNPWAESDHATIEDNRPAVYYNNEYSNQETESNRVYSSLPEDNSISNVNENEDTSVAVNNSEDVDRLRLDLAPAVALASEVSLESSNNRTNNNAGGRASNQFGGNGFQMNAGFGQNGGGRGQWGSQGAGQGGFGQPGFAGRQQNQTPANTPSRAGTVTPAAPITPATPEAQQNRIATPAQRTQSGQAFQEKTYVIQEGDNNLAKISKKFYGETEGNRLVNINKIYERNKDVLKSADKIFVGQKIVIPQPAQPVEPQPSEVLQGSMFRNVASVGSVASTEPVAANRTNNNSRLDTGRWYVVKEDDSLWKISAEQLGNGARFEEISKINTDILNDKNKLKPGMKLRLPIK